MFPLDFIKIKIKLIFRHINNCKMIKFFNVRICCLIKTKKYNNKKWVEEMSEDVIFGFTVEKNKEDGLNTTNVSDKKEFLNPRQLKSENSWFF